MTNPVLEAIADRRSIRGYKPEQITKEQLDILLKAANEAPSARNSQAWHFTVVQNKDIIKEVVDEANAKLNRDASADIFYGAPTVIFISCDPDAHPWARLDCGIAVENIALAAHSIGLGSVIIGMAYVALDGDKKEHFSKLLKFPEKFTFAISIAIGVPDMTKDAHPIEAGRIDIIE
ncbi:MAG: nitroreductase [Clostridiales bacterium]|nr:nitroreductase [Clostridiales bacterium]